MTAKEYRAIKAINSSSLKDLLTSPLHYWHEYRNPDYVKKDTPSMIMGTALHSIVLEGDVTHILKPKDMSGNSNAAKKALKEWKAELAPDMVIVTPAQAKHIEGMAKSVAEHPDLDGLFRDDVEGEEHLTEETIVFYHPKYRELCKARVDLIKSNSEEIMLVDLKTTSDASKNGFSRAADNFKYHLQMAFYLEAVRSTFKMSEGTKLTHQFVCVENSAPYAIGIHELSKNAISQGQREIDQAMALYEKYVKKENWRHYPVTEEKVDLPRYAQDYAYHWDTHETPF